MRIQLFICLVVFFFVSCQKEGKYSVEGGSVVIHVPEDLISVAQDSVISNVDFLPLETTPECLIAYISDFKFKDSLIFIQEKQRRLLVFNNKGKYKYEIGRFGEGPGEHVWVTHFIITDDNTVEILDAEKIECYTLEGKHLSTKRYNYVSEGFYCYPDNFIHSPTGGYYFWGGFSMNTPEENRDKTPFMVHLNDSMQVDETYFTIGLSNGSSSTRFSRYEDNIMISPIFPFRDIHQIDKNGKITVRYTFDFGNKTYRDSLELGGMNREARIAKFQSLEGYVSELYSFFETDRWVFQDFGYKTGAYSVLYSKENNKAHILSSYKADKKLDEFRFWGANQKMDNQLVMDIDAELFLLEMDRLSPEAYKKYNLSRFESVKEDDNPVLVFYTLR